jgi:hypothetical protein
LTASPYLQVDLNALDKAHDCAQCAGIPVGSVVHGLLRLWRWAWSEKQDRLTPAHVRGFFGGDEHRVAEALEAFGFVELLADGAIRVRGAARYLRISEARSAGGHASKGNLKRGKVRPSAAGDQPETSREDAPGSTPALTSSIEHRASKALKAVEALQLLPGSLPAAAGDQPETSREPAGGVAGSQPDPQPETSRETPRPPPTPLAPTPSVEAQAPRKVVPETPGESLWRAHQAIREELSYAREHLPNPRSVSAFANEALLRLNGDEERLLAGYRRWLSEPWVREHGGPWRLWMRQWPEKVPPGSIRAQGPPGAPCCARCGAAAYAETWGATPICVECTADWQSTGGEGEASFREWLANHQAEAVQ